MKSFFITGIPTSGKTYLATRISKEFNLPILSVDKFRKEMIQDSELKKWVYFYWNIDEKEYYTNTTCNKQWENLVNQSEAFWQFTKEKIADALRTEPHIVEGVNLLPHLMSETDLQGLILLGESEKRIFRRIRANPRWGETVELQKLEAEAFFHCEGSWYRKEAEKYNYSVFTDTNEAYDYQVNLA